MQEHRGYCIHLRSHQRLQQSAHQTHRAKIHGPRFAFERRPRDRSKLV